MDDHISRIRSALENDLWIFSNCEVTYYKHDFPFASEADLDAAMKEER